MPGFGWWTFHDQCLIYSVRQKKVTPYDFLQFSQQSLGISKQNFADRFSYPIYSQKSF